MKVASMMLSFLVAASVFFTTANGLSCKPVLCDMHCENGWALDESGCPFCECAVCKPNVCKLLCLNGYAKDENGCEICKCAEIECPAGEEKNKITNKCVPVTCKSENACTTKEKPLCVSTTEPILCIQQPCPEFTCQAKPACPAGEEMNNSTKKCVPVSCKSENACTSNQVCVMNEKPVHCVTQPCPQFKCQTKTKCNTGEEQDAFGNCIAVSCLSKNACAADETCTPVKKICLTKPCPQLTCCAKGTTYSTFQNTCIATSCDAKDACRPGQFCIPDDYAICKHNPCPK